MGENETQSICLKFFSLAHDSHVTWLLLFSFFSEFVVHGYFSIICLSAICHPHNPVVSSINNNKPCLPVHAVECRVRMCTKHDYSELTLTPVSITSHRIKHTRVWKLANVKNTHPVMVAAHVSTISVSKFT